MYTFLRLVDSIKHYKMQNVLSLRINTLINRRYKELYEPVYEKRGLMT